MLTFFSHEPKRKLVREGEVDESRSNKYDSEVMLQLNRKESNECYFKPWYIRDRFFKGVLLLPGT